MNKKRLCNPSKFSHNKKLKQDKSCMKKILVWSIILTVITGLLFVSYIVLLFLPEDIILKCTVIGKITDILNASSSIMAGISFGFWVSYVFERANENGKEKLKREQQKYILSSVQDSLLWLLSLEYKNLSEYLTLSDTTSNHKFTNEEIDVEKALSVIKDCLSEINNYASACYAIPDVIDSSYLKRIKRREELAYKLSLPIYEKLNKDLLKIYEDANYYFMFGVLNKEQLKIIHDIQKDIYLVIAYSNENDIELLFEYKNNFFTEIKNNLNLFNIQLINIVI